MRYGKALAALFILLIVSVPGAFCEEDGLLEITATLEPREMVTPGDAEITVTITNTSGEEVRDVTMSSYDGLTTVEVGHLAPGEARTVVRSHAVTEDELAQGRVVFTVSHSSQTSPGATVNYIVSAYVVRAIAAPEAEFTRILSASVASTGEEITVAYRVTNTGNEPLTDLRVLDSLGDFSGRADRLDVGESLLFLNRVIVTGDCASTASLTYGAASLEEVRTLSLTGEGIRIAPPELQLLLTVSGEGDPVEAVFTARNGGEGALYDLRVYDAGNGGLLFDGLALMPGEEITLRRVCSVRGAENLRWRAEAVTEAGNPVEAEVSCDLTAPESVAEPLLTLSAEADMTEISESGCVTVQLNLLCAGSDARNVRVSEQTLGEIRMFAFAPDGIAIAREILVPVEEDRVFHFTAEYENGAGETVIVSANPIEIRITPGGEEPLPLPGEDAPWLRSVSRTLDGTGVYTGMLLGVGAVLLVLVVILSVRSRREKQKRRRRNRRNRKEETDV